MSVRHLAKGASLPPLKPDTWRMFSMRWCPYAQRTRLVMLHKNIPYETVNVNLKHKPTWLFERNPLGLVPVIEKGDLLMHDSLICNDLIDDLYPLTPLRPTDSLARARQRMLCDRFTTVIAAFYKVAQPTDEGQKQRRRMTRRLDEFEALLQGTYFGGSSPGMLDFNIWPWMERLSAIHEMTGWDPLPGDRYPKLTGWLTTMYQLPAVKATAEPKEHHMRFMMALASGQPQYDFATENSVSANL